MALPQQRLDEIRLKAAEEEARNEWPRLSQAEHPEIWRENALGHVRAGYAAAAYRYMVEAEERERWIPVEEGLPEPRKAVLVYAPEMNEPITCMYYDPDSESVEFGEWVSEPSGPGRGGWSSLAASDVTHWKPLPSPSDQP